MNLKGPTLALYELLDQTATGGQARSLARASAALAEVMMERGDAKSRSQFAQGILTLYGHPFVWQEVKSKLSLAEQIVQAQERAPRPCC